MKFFNNAGPIKTDIHYNIDPIERLDKKELLYLIDSQKYFILHAPRQTGKTSTLLALRDFLNKEGRYHCVYANFEAGQAARDDIEMGMKSILGEIERRIGLMDENLLKLWPDSAAIMAKVGATGALAAALAFFCEKLKKPLVFLIDEIDSLVGDTLISVLRQIRSGYDTRPAAFPQSIILCGLREVRDYRIYSDTEKAIITGGSAFNIKSESLRMGDFKLDEVKRLYIQHTEYTGQKFEEDIWDYVWELTEGQPWLVNTLAYEACFRIEKDRSKLITRDIIERAKEHIIINRMTHIDILIDKLREERVRRVIEPMLASADGANFNESDVSYVIDLGLIKRKEGPGGPRGNYRISNGIYKEVIPRELVYADQYGITNDTPWYVDGGRLNMAKLLTDFQKFYRENSEIWLERYEYKEAGPHLILMAFLQRVVNGGGRIFREYGLGRRRMDIMVDFGGEKHCIELKVYRGAQPGYDEEGDTKAAYERVLNKGMEQLKEYMDKCGAREGHLLIFDRAPGKLWRDRIFSRPAAGGITVWGA